jgi:AcrR family transcriptional regulator
MTLTMDALTHHVLVTTVGGEENLGPVAVTPAPDAAPDPEVQRLLAAAQTVLSRSGWWGFKVESVLREAKLSTRSFYRHFQSKSELLLAVLETEMKQAAARLRRAAAVEGDALTQLESWVEATLAMAYSHELARPANLFAEHWRELLAEYPDRMHSVVDSMVATVLPVIQRGRDEGRWPEARPAEDGLCVFYLVSGLTADIAVAHGTPSHDDIRTILMPFIERALSGRMPA